MKNRNSFYSLNFISISNSICSDYHYSFLNIKSLYSQLIQLCDTLLRYTNMPFFPCQVEYFPQKNDKCQNSHWIKALFDLLPIWRHDPPSLLLNRSRKNQQIIINLSVAVHDCTVKILPLSWIQLLLLYQILIIRNDAVKGYWKKKGISVNYVRPYSENRLYLI